MRRQSVRAAVLGLLLVGGFPVLAQQSTNFSMERISVTSAGTTAASTNFATTVVIGQDSPAGASSFCNSGFVNTTGFWSVLGDAFVPIVLGLGKNAVDPNQAELSWSGASPTFQLYSSTSASDVLDPVNLTLETSACDTNDPSPANLVFYKVIPKP